mgnify:CR=1 FL=1
MKNLLIIIAGLSGAYWFSERYDHLNGLLYAINVFLGGFAGWSISSLLFKASGNLKSSKHSSSTIGIISELGYSTIRVNKRPRFKASVNYLGIEKIFEPLPEDTHLTLSKGDKVVIKYNPDDPIDSYFDLKESIELKA